MTTDAQRDAEVEFTQLTRDRLKALALKYWISVPEDPEQAENADVENLWGMIYGDDVPDRWATVTQTGGGQPAYFIKTYPTRKQAENASIEYVTDDLYSEFPAALCDLFYGDEPWGKLLPVTKLIPVFADWDALAWANAKEAS